MLVDIRTKEKLMHPVDNKSLRRAVQHVMLPASSVLDFYDASKNGRPPDRAWARNIYIDVTERCATFIGSDGYRLHRAVYTAPHDVSIPETVHGELLIPVKYVKQWLKDSNNTATSVSLGGALGEWLLLAKSDRDDLHVFPVHGASTLTGPTVFWEIRQRYFRSEFTHIFKDAVRFITEHGDNGPASVALWQAYGETTLKVFTHDRERLADFLQTIHTVEKVHTQTGSKIERRQLQPVYVTDALKYMRGSDVWFFAHPEPDSMFGIKEDMGFNPASRPGTWKLSAYIMPVVNERIADPKQRLDMP